MIEKMQKENREELKKALKAIDRVGKEYPSIYKLKILCWSSWRWRIDEILRSLKDVARGASMAYYMWWCNSCIDAINNEVKKMNECICIDCPNKNKCPEYQGNILSDKAYYDWVYKMNKCKVESEETDI